MNSAFSRALIGWLGSKCQLPFNSEQLIRQNRASRVEFPIIFRYIERNTLYFCICMVYTEIIIHLHFIGKMVIIILAFIPSASNTIFMCTAKWVSLTPDKRTIYFLKYLMPYIYENAIFINQQFCLCRDPVSLLRDQGQLNMKNNLICVELCYYSM